MSALAFELLGEIFAPLETLLASGGDTRLQLDAATRLNGYGCRPFPRPEAFTFASSTATSISERGFAAADAVRHALIRDGLHRGLESAFDDHVEAQRVTLLRLLDLDGAAPSVVFSPSGTDSELHALFVARTLLGTPIASVVVAADETGSGIAYAACGKHFNSLTAQGMSVEKGHPVRGLADDIASMPIPLRDAQGHVRPLAEIDEAVIAAVGDAIKAGHKVLLHAMDRSKLGGRAPSLACLFELGARWPGRVQILVDACQMRLSRSRLRWHLDRGHLVLVTGSKFFTGPPFSGALLVPAGLSARMAAAPAPPAGLHDYTSRSDWPRSWESVRRSLRERLNLGQYLRWSAALEEMRAYLSVPASYRKSALAQFGVAAQQLIAGEGALQLLPAYEDCDTAATLGIDDDEMAARTIFPFLVRRSGSLLSLAECSLLYRALNEDVSRSLPATASPRDQQLARQLCHIGQPVALRAADDGDTAALRISAGARIVSDTWSDAGDTAALQHEFEQVRIILDKLDLLLRHFDALSATAAAARNEAAA